MSVWGVFCILIVANSLHFSHALSYKVPLHEEIAETAAREANFAGDMAALKAGAGEPDTQATWQGNIQVK